MPHDAFGIPLQLWQHMWGSRLCCPRGEQTPLAQRQAHQELDADSGASRHANAWQVEMLARVRRACMVAGMSVREAARVFGLHRDTVSKKLRLVHMRQVSWDSWNSS